VRPLFYPLYGWLLEPFVKRRLKAPIKTRAGNLTQAQVDKITDACGAPRGTARIEGPDLLIFPCEDILTRGRVLQALQATGETTLSSVGVQAHRRPESI
jgi:hypothetical protein